MLFIEKQANRAQHLQALVARRYPEAQRPRTVEVRTVHASCEDALVPVLAQIGADSGPVFVNFDGWGVDTPMSLVRHVSHYPSPEVLITFERQWFVRFANKEDTTSGDHFFGDDQWRRLASVGTAPEKKRALIDDYQRRLAEVGYKYSLVFEMLDEGGHELLLVYATGSLRGLEKMKDAMWAVDPVLGQRFPDPRDIDQLSFELSERADLTLLQTAAIGIVGRWWPHGPGSPEGVRLGTDRVQGLACHGRRKRVGTGEAARLPPCEEALRVHIRTGPAVIVLTSGPRSRETGRPGRRGRPLPGKAVGSVASFP